MKKYISFVVPCYNSENYMNKCIDSLLLGEDKVEIIIVDDGSKDNTGKIADEYKDKYPDIVKVIHQENGGHGAGITNGLKEATGKYFKVVDSDDWVDEKALKRILKRIKSKKCDADLIIMNYVYTYTDGRKDQVINFGNIFKNDIETTWNDMKMFKPTQYLSLHSMMYKTSILRKKGIDLPKHCFYEDNLFIYLPMPYVKTIFYLDADFYRYFIGRSDQSVNETQLVKRSSHQVLVSKLVCNEYDLDDIENKKLRKMMKRECVFLVTIGVVFSRMKYDEEGELQYKDLWNSVKENNPKLYKKIRYTTKATLVSIPGKFGRYLCVKGYKIAHNLVNFN